MIRIQNKTETQYRNNVKNQTKEEKNGTEKVRLLIFLRLDQKSEPTIISNPKYTHLMCELMWIAYTKFRIRSHNSKFHQFVHSE